MGKFLAMYNNYFSCSCGSGFACQRQIPAYPCPSGRRGTGRRLWRIILTLICSIFPLTFYGQALTHPPFVSAVTENSARLFVRIDAVTAFDVVLSTDSATFSNPLTFSSSTVAGSDTTALVDLTGLNADTRYFYKINISGNPVTVIRSFRTFPVPGTVSNFTFAFGSCQMPSAAPAVEPIFDRIIEANPRFFLNCGDWGYPDTTDNIPSDNDFFPAVYDRIIETYRFRYSAHTNMNEMMKRIPIDYVYDDHDFMNNNSSATTSSYDGTSGNEIQEIANPPGARENIIRAYVQFFPAYPLVDTSQGIYHSFRYGNIEVFMCDNRSERSPNFEILSESGNLYSVNSVPGHTMLGQQQFEWLKNGLKNSTAGWKFIVTGVAFNKAYRDILEYALQPSMQLTIGKPVITAIVDTWAGYLAEQDSLLDWCFRNNITNVVFLTSDSHTSAIDDGANAGFPELMSGNLSQTNSRLANLMSQFGFFIWNGGGQGLNGNTNYKDAYGKVDVYGNDSLILSIIDTEGVVIASIPVFDGFLPAPIGINEENLKPDLNMVFYLKPNPAADNLYLELKNEISDKIRVEFFDQSGKKVKTFADVFSGKKVQTVSVIDLNDGIYYCVLKTSKYISARKFLKR
ncbi:MAG: alkaline phosphatase D family protein [Bacteroidetes bacterium]|nr:alkaline phosphatase D family protein [Bacteroidota bacterium]